MLLTLSSYVGRELLHLPHGEIRARTCNKQEQCIVFNALLVFSHNYVFTFTGSSQGNADEIR